MKDAKDLVSETDSSISEMEKAEVKPDDLKIASIKAKEQQAEMNSLEFTNGFMQRELEKIRD